MVATYALMRAVWYYGRAARTVARRRIFGEPRQVRKEAAATANAGAKPAVTGRTRETYWQRLQICEG